MFKGVGPEAHGYIDWDTRNPAFEVTSTDEKGNFPSFFSIYRAAFPEREMGYLYQWEGMKYIFDMDDFDYSEQFPVSDSGCDAMRDAAVTYILDKRPSLAVFVWDYPDHIGHSIGWYSDEYMNGLNHIDSIIEDVVNSCIEAEIIDNTFFVITSDHGGHGKTHGQAVMTDLETPFFLLGKGIIPGEIQGPLMQYDVAAILADYMSLQHPEGWRGKTPGNILR
jgi:predicted AlkP superfamily pyrophosphatase or phosphodiesterase